MSNLKKVVGLFGTCGDSQWRSPVMARLEAAGHAYFNPVVPNWTPECAAIEAEHLATDQVLLFVITGETEGIASIGETGWAALSAHKNGQTFILVVEDFPDNNPKSAQNRARKLVRTHAEKAGLKVFSSIEAATDATLEAMNA